MTANFQKRTLQISTLNDNSKHLLSPYCVTFPVLCPFNSLEPPIRLRMLLLET